MAQAPVYKRIAKASAIYGLGMIASRIGSIILLPIYTRYLTTADYGVLELLDLTLAVAGALIGGRFVDALFYYYNRAETKFERDRVLSTTILGSWLIGFLGVAVGLMASGFLSQMIFQTRMYTTFFEITFINFALSMPIEAGMSWLRAEERAQSYVAASIARLMLGVGFSSFFLIVWRMGVVGVLWSTTASTAILAITLTGLALRKRFGYDGRVFLKLVKFSAPLGIGSIAIFAIHFGDRFFLQRYVPLSLIGIYALTYKMGMLVSQVQSAFATHWTANMYSALSGDDAADSFARINTYMMFVISWAGLGIICFSGPVLRLMVTPAYLAALPFIPWITIAYVLRAEGDYFRYSLLLDRKTTLDAAMNWGVGLFCVGAYALLIPRYTLWGAVMATLLTFVFLVVAARRVTYRYRPYPLEKARLGHIALIAGVLVVPIMISAVPPGWPEWLYALMGSAGFPVLMYLTGFFRPGEKKQMRESITAFGRRIAASNA